MDYQPNFSRKERILILPNNTLRVPEAMFLLELYAYNKIKLPSFEENLYKCITRKNKDLSKIFNIPQKLNDKYNNNWASYYDIAPRTKMYEYIDILSSQKFIEDTVILFSDKNAKDDAFKNDYYDGTIDKLEEYIKTNQITAIVLDDIDLIQLILDRKKIDINNLTFIISKVGYNYQYNKSLDILMPKKELYDAEKSAYIEVAIISLFDFSNELFDKLCGGKDNNE